MHPLKSVKSPAPQSGHYHQGVPLETQAARLFPDNQFNQAAWIKAVRYLRRREPSIWKLDRPVGATVNVTRY